jgi:alpha/beta superfamily hydrolase
MNTDAQDILEESVEIPAARGPLAGVLAYPFVGTPQRAALIVGPHPLMGGRLENNVVRHVARGLAERGLLTLRFRFAGSAVSANVMQQFWTTERAPEDPERPAEAAAALEWLTPLCAGPMLLVGYSFGASLLNALISERTAGAALIGPTLAQHDYDDLARRDIPKLVFTADNDFATPLATTQAWFDGAAEPKKFVIIPAAEHFYRGQEERLVEEIIQWLPT